MKTPTPALFFFLTCLITTASFGQQKINLAGEHQGNRVRAQNRSLSVPAKYNNALEMDAREGDGIAILEEIEFESGSLEIELLGENVQGKSFIGIAFNIQDEETYEVIYFRPFNFKATEQIRREHMVQYIAHPEFTWFRLREERTGVFENELPMPPDPDNWFGATIDISPDHVRVYVNESPDPVLAIERLAESRSGKIGLWTGHGSSGRFRNLNLRPEL